MSIKKVFSLVLAFSLLCLSGSETFAGKSSSSSGSGGGSRSSSGGGASSSKSSFSGGSKSSSSSSSGSKSSFSGGSKSSSSSATNTSSSGSFSGGSSKKTVTSTPVAGKQPTSVSKKPAASNFDSLAGKDAKKVESRQAYEKATTPAASYKTPAGKDVKLDPKDKQIENLRGRLDEHRWANRQSRQDSFYGGYAGRPVILYNDPYHPMLTYWLMSQSLDVTAMWCYHHQASMDSARLNSMYAENANLRARVAALEAQKVARNPTYAPPGIDPDLAYNDGFVDAAYNPHPKTVTEYEYDDDGGGVSVGSVLLVVFFVLLGLGAVVAFYRSSEPKAPTS